MLPPSALQSNRTFVIGAATVRERSMRQARKSLPYGRGSDQKRLWRVVQRNMQLPWLALRLALQGSYGPGVRYGGDIAPAL